jgi:heme A synthase
MSSHIQQTRLTGLTSNAERSSRPFSYFAWVVLAYNLPVILWGAYVRVSFSGDGCGANWPFCNGQLIPQRMSVPTAIEFTHRMMTSVDSIAVIGLCAWAFLAFPKRDVVRRYAVLSLVFLFVEALLGAGLVLFRLVAKDQSAGRAWYLSAHLTNTMLLLAALTGAAWFASAGVGRFRLKSLSSSMVAALAITVFISITGAITALGDTLFPATSLQSGMRQDFTSASSVLLRLRVIHPLVAATGAGYLLWVAASAFRKQENRGAKKAASWVAAVTIFQLAAGMVNMSLLAPIWMQLIHLFIADVLWVATLILALSTAHSVARGRKIE